LVAVRSVFVGPNGVRAGWRFLAYAVVLIALENAFGRFLVPPALDALHAGHGLTAQALLVIEVFGGLAVLVATAILAAFERRRIDAYGLALRLAFGKRFWEGAAIGVVSAGAVGIAMVAVGAMVVHGFALRATAVPNRLAIFSTLRFRVRHGRTEVPSVPRRAISCCR
jgi:uncharacterized protein